MATELNPTRGYLIAGSWAVVTITVTDIDESQIAKTAIASIEITLVDEFGNIINNRAGQTVLDANGGTVATDGTLTLYLSNLDNVMSSSEADVETHTLFVTWGWNDGTEDLTHTEDFWMTVKRLPS